MSHAEGAETRWWLWVRGRQFMARLVRMDARSLVGANTIRPGNFAKAIDMLRDVGVGIVGIEISLLQITA